jgi:hypothetical protein
MTLNRVRVRATALRGRNGADGNDGAPGAEGPQGRPGYRIFSTWALAEAATGAFADQAMVVTQASGTHTDPVTADIVPNRGRYAWSTSPAGWKWIDGDVVATQGIVIEAIAPATPETGSSQVAYEYTSPSRTGGNPVSVKFREVFTYNPYAAGGIGSGSPKLTNRVVAWGWNITNSFTPIDINEGAPNIRIEAKFAVPSRNPAKSGQWIPGGEFHHAMHTAGVGGSEYRPISIYAPHLAEDWGHDSSVSMQGAIYAFADGYKNVHVSFDWLGAAGDAKVISLSNQTRMAFAGNDRAIFTQANAAGNAQVPLPYLDAQNNLRISQAVYGTFDVPVVNALGFKSLLTMVGTAGIGDGARLLYLNTHAVTGSVTGLDLSDMSCSTRLEGVKVRNTHASGAAGMRIQGNGATYLDFFNEANFHRWGLRLKANGDFTIGQTEQGVDIADALRINFTTLQTSFLYPPKLPSYTVAGLPNPTTVGAGAQAYCTNESGGAVNVFSDATNWRRVTDRAIAA